MDSLLKQAMERTLEARGMTVADYGKRLGISASAVSLKLTGRRAISVEELQDMAFFLGTSMETVLWLNNL